MLTPDWLSWRTSARNKYFLWPFHESYNQRKFSWLDKEIQFKLRVGIMTSLKAKIQSKKDKTNRESRYINKQCWWFCVLQKGREEFMKWNEASVHLCMDRLNGLERKNPDQMFNSWEKFLSVRPFMMGKGSVWTWDFPHWCFLPL